MFIIIIGINVVLSSLSSCLLLVQKYCSGPGYSKHGSVNPGLVGY